MSILSASCLRLQQQLARPQWGCTWRSSCKHTMSGFWHQPTLQPRQIILAFQRNLKKIRSFDTKIQQMDKLSRLNAFKPQYKWDKVPKDFELVYNHEVNMNYVIIGAKLISIAMIAVTMGGSGHLIYEQWDKVRWDENTLPIVIIAGIFSTSSILVLMLTRKMFSKIYFNPSSQEFIAVRRTVFGRLEHLRYTEADIHVLPPEKKFTNIFQGETVSIKGRKLVLNTDNFVLPVYHNIHFKLTTFDSGRHRDTLGDGPV